MQLYQTRYKTILNSESSRVAGDLRHRDDIVTPL